MLIGLDGCQDKHKVYEAYNDGEGKTHEFILNGLIHANKLFGRGVFKLSDWKVIGRYNEIEARHEAFYSPTKDVLVDGINIKAGELVRVEESYKYSPSQAKQLWKASGLVESERFGNSTGEYSK